MRLSKVQIKNFRSIRDAEIGFEPRFRILIGKNEAGKSNLLAACALIDPQAKLGPADLRETCDGEEPVNDGYVRFIFDLSAKELLTIQQLIKPRVLAKDQILCRFNRRELSAWDFLNEFKNWIYRVKIPTGERTYSYWNKSSFAIGDDWLVPKIGVDSNVTVDTKAGSKVVKNLIAAHVSLVPENLRDSFEPATIERVAANYARVIDLLVEKKIPKCLFWTYSDANVLPQSIDIESFKNDPKTCEPLRAMFLLAKEHDPSSAIVKAQEKANGLKNLLTRVARAATADIKQRWKELKSIEIVLAPNGGQIDAAVRDEYNEYAFNRRSDGFKRFVSFLILVSARSSVKDFSEILFIQDEPDLGLHPTGVRSLLQELIALSENNYVLISSHSIFMVDKERIDRHLVVNKRQESTTVESVDRSVVQDEEVLLNALGYSLFEQIKPINLVFEGWRDKRLFTVFCRRKNEPGAQLSKLMKSKVGLVHAMGVNDVPKVVTLFESIDRDCFVVSDSDQVAVQKQRVLSQERPEVIWSRYDELSGTDAVLTAEDFIKKDRLRACLKQVLELKGIQSDIPQEVFTPAEGGIVASVSNVLPLQPGEIKGVLNEWKSRIFDDLEIGDIEASYENVAAGILKRLKEMIGND